MECVFSALAQKLLADGTLRYMVSKTGEVLPILVNSENKIFEIGRLVGGLPPLQPLTAIVDGLGDLALSYQMDRGFQKAYRMIEGLQQSLGVLQTTTTIIGAGVAVTGVLGAVNLYQVLKLREDVRQLRKELKQEFSDLKQVLAEQHAEVLERIEQKAFEAQLLKLGDAYAKFLQATKLVGLAVEMQDSTAKDNTLAAASFMMNECLAVYNNQQLLADMNAAGKLRRFECAWTIEQAIAIVLLLQNQSIAASKCLAKLQTKIKGDMLLVANSCESHIELDFVFPELIRIQNQDLIALEIWQTQIDVLRSLPPSELAQLPNLEDQEIQPIDVEVTQVSEEAAYLELKAKSDFRALKDQLRFMIKPNLRREYESAITDQAPKLGYPALVPSNWQDISDATVANLFWYFNKIEGQNSA